MQYNKLTDYIKKAVSIFALVYIVFRLYDEIHFIRLYNILNLVNIKHLWIILICLVLMAGNWYLESLKWKILLKPVQSITIKHAVYSVLFGLSSAIFTPYRLGEYLGRPLILDKKTRISSVFALFIGSVAQSIITVSMAICGLTIFSLNTKYETSIIPYPLSILTISGFFLLFSLIVFFKPGILFTLSKKIPKLNKWSARMGVFIKYRYKHLMTILILSQLRYAIFFVQYILLLYFFGIQISISEAFIAISLSYLFLFSIPGIPLAEPGIRGSLALFFIGYYTAEDVGILGASLSLWFINLALPATYGAIFCTGFKDKYAENQD